MIMRRSLFRELTARRIKQSCTATDRSLLMHINTSADLHGSDPVDSGQAANRHEGEDRSLLPTLLMRRLKRREDHMAKNYRDIRSTVSGSLARLREDMPEVMKSFGALGQSALRGGTLDGKTKELIALS